VLSSHKEALIAQLYSDYGVSTVDAIEKIARSNFWVRLEERISGFLSKFRK
jgi:hypothetical protein